MRSATFPLRADADPRSNSQQLPSPPPHLHSNLPSLTRAQTQWFLTLATTAPQLKKLTGKYVAFGQADLTKEATRECLARLEQLGDGKGGTSRPVWIERCGVEE